MLVMVLLAAPSVTIAVFEPIFYCREHNEQNDFFVTKTHYFQIIAGSKLSK